MKLLAKHVISARGLLGMSQVDLAEAAGVSADTVNRFEREKAPPLKEDSLWRIQAALEQCGIEFMNSGRPGVRYHPDRDRRRMTTSELAKPTG
jgi:DNA-binding XRE family transcriptional regulator